MDHWDPAVTDGFANDRESFLFNNAGVSSSSGGSATSIEGMAANAIAFIGALGLSKVMCWFSPSADSSLRRSPAGHLASFASWSLSGPGTTRGRGYGKSHA